MKNIMTRGYFSPRVLTRQPNIIGLSTWKNGKKIAVLVAATRSAAGHRLKKSTKADRPAKAMEVCLSIERGKNASQKKWGPAGPTSTTTPQHRGQAAKKDSSGGGGGGGGGGGESVERTTGTRSVAQ